MRPISNPMVSVENWKKQKQKQAKKFVFRKGLDWDNLFTQRK